MSWFLLPPKMEDPVRAQQARLAHKIILSLGGIITVSSFGLIVIHPAAVTVRVAAETIVLYVALTAVCVGINARGWTRLASYIFITVVLLNVAVRAPFAGGLQSPSATMFYIFALTGGLLLGARVGLFIAIICALYGLGLVVAQDRHLLPVQTIYYSPFAYWWKNVMFMAIVIVLVRLASQSIEESNSRLKAELNERRKVQKRLEIALDAAEIGIWEGHVAGDKLYLDNGAMRFLGLSPDEQGVIKFADWIALVHPEDRPKVETGISNLLSGDTRARAVYRCLHPDGRLRYIEGTGSSILDENDHVVSHAGTVMDVTLRETGKVERDQLLSKLQKRVKELKLLNSVSQLLRDRALDHALMDELVVLLPQGWMHQECCEARIRYGDMIATTREWRESPWLMSADFRVGDRDGTVEIAYLSECPLACEGPFWTEERALLNSIVEMLVAYLEKAEAAQRERMLEERLLQAQKMEAMGTLAGGIAHDFNNLLAAIMGFSSLLEADFPKDSKHHRFAERISASCERGKEIVRQILSFARAGVQDRQVIELSEYLQDCEEILRKTVSSRVSISFSYGARPLYIEANPGQVTQLLSNLCKNAGEASVGAGTVINVELSYAPKEKIGFIEGCSLHEGVALAGQICEGVDYACLRVQDKGAGIQGEILKRVFDPFFTTRGRTQGTGLGLAVVHRVVEAQGGFCLVETQLGQGTSFSIYLPIIETSRAMSEIGRAAPAAVPDNWRALTGDEQIMIIDDEIDVLHSTALFLDRMGYDVIAVDDPVEALEIFQDNPSAWDLVIVDQIMPNMRGSDLIREMRRNSPSIRAIICSGYADMDIVPSGDSENRQAVPDLFLQKPVSIKSLATAIRQALDGTLHHSMSEEHVS
jgi:PAS domain S-box-containing protein